MPVNYFERAEKLISAVCVDLLDSVCSLLLEEIDGLKSCICHVALGLDWMHRDKPAIFFDDGDEIDFTVYWRRLQLPLRIHMKGSYLPGAGQRPVEASTVLVSQTSDAVRLVTCNMRKKTLPHM